MAAPFPQVVLDRLLEACEGIRESRGYRTTVALVGLYDPAAAYTSARPYIEIRDGTLGRVYDASASGGWLCEQDVEITVYAAPIEHEERTLGDALRELRQDLFDAMMEAFDPLGASPFAADLRAITMHYLHELDENDPIEGIRAELTIRYRHDLIDQTLPIPS